MRWIRRTNWNTETMKSRSAGKFTRLSRGRRRRALRSNLVGFSARNRLIVIKRVFLEKRLYSPKLENIFWRANSENEKLDKTRDPNKSLRRDTSEHRFYFKEITFARLWIFLICSFLLLIIKGISRQKMSSKGLEFCQNTF